MISFVTSNQNKIGVAQQFLAPHGINFQSLDLTLTEIQSEKIEEIAISKAQDAYKQIQKPLFVNDYGWSNPALNGFPGAYMKYINTWFTPQNMLDLRRDQTDREIILTVVICYMDNKTTKTFTAYHKSIVLKQSQGEGLTGLTTVSLTEDGLSIAQRQLMRNKPSAKDDEPVWEEFADWLKEHKPQVI